MISCLAVIDKRDTILCLKLFDDSIYSRAQLTEMLYLCCDIYQERCNQNMPTDGYLGFLTALDGIVFFGSVSNTGNKFLAGLQAERRHPSDAKMRPTLQKLQTVFSKLGESISKHYYTFDLHIGSHEPVQLSC